MKILLLGMIAFSFNAFANQQCIFENDQFYTITRSVSIVKDSLESINGSDVLWAERYFTHDDTSFDVSFSEMRKDDITDINLSYITSLIDNETYVMIDGYPGENYYSTVYNIRTNESVMEIHDGDLAFCNVKI
jgi:hypothetical protein